MLLKSRQYDFGRVFLCRLSHQSDLLEALTAFCTEQSVNAAFISAIGAVTKATVAYYEQEAQRYRTISLEERLELVNLAGNVSLKDGKPMVHAHVVFARENGETRAGHLLSPTLVFAGEAFIAELRGEPLVREFDQPTGLSLWAALQ